MRHTIHADIRVPSQGNEKREAEYCYLYKYLNDDRCPVGGGVCRFGLSEIEVPKTCPLRTGAITIVLSVAGKVDSEIVDNLTAIWKAKPELFEKVPKEDFDRHARQKDFSQGPTAEGQSKWAKEFGPYSPEQWAFGLLSGGSYVKTRT